jgi:8-oxo-dGTP diphosphatase
MSRPEPVHVAVGVLINADNEVLIARRHAQSHQGGLWEFPGGKVEPGETLLQALNREFREELGVSVHQAHPITTSLHDYGDKCVLLDVWEITEAEGEACGLEGQQIAWHPRSRLKELEFPAANQRILQVLELPRELAITPELENKESLLAYVQQVSKQGITAIQIRQKNLSVDQYSDWFKSASELNGAEKPLLFAHGACGGLNMDYVEAIHLDSRHLMSLGHRPVADSIVLSASCHNLEELQKAQAIGVDLALLSPVASIIKYPNGQCLGWQGFAELSRQVSVPVYALGGLQRSDLGLARLHGASGIAGMGMFDAGRSS